MQISFDPSRILKHNEILRLKNGNLYVENANYRKSRFFLIRFFTRNQYDQNEIISKLIKTAVSIQSIPARIDLGNSYLDAAQEQLNRAKFSNADLSRFGLIRWLRGTPIVNCTKLEKDLELARNLIKVQKPPVQPLQLPTLAQLQPEEPPSLAQLQPEEPLPLAQPQPEEPLPLAQPQPKEPPPLIQPEKLLQPVKPEELLQSPQAVEPQKYTKPEASPIQIPEVSQEYAKFEVRKILQEALNNCEKKKVFAYQRHASHLKRFIIILDRREEILARYKRMGRGHHYNEPISGYVLHGEEQCPIPLLRSAPEYYAQVYSQIKNDEGKKNSFFTKVFSGSNACLEGNFKTILNWEYSLKNLEFQFDSTNNYLNHLGEIHRVFKEYKFLEFFKKNNSGREYNQFDDYHLKIYKSYFEAPWITNYHNKDNRYVFKRHWDKMRIFQNSVDTKGNLLAFILEKKCLPLKCSDKELTENNIKEHLDQYYLLVFGE